MARSQQVYFCSPLGDGSLKRPWQIANLSDSGARLTVADPDSMPNSFIIVLKGEQTIWRRCVVVWRSATEIGISFNDAE
jgi:PilZ domain